MRIRSVGIAFSLLWMPFFTKAQQSITIDGVVDQLLESNYGIKMVRNEVVIAENNNNPGAAGYLPTITINADRYWSAYDTRQTFFSGQVNEASGAKSNSVNASVMLNWTFFDGFKMFAIDKRLDAQEEVATVRLKAEIEMKLYQASVQFFTLLQLQQLDAIYRESIALSNARYEQQILREKMGSSSEFQLIQARLDLYSDSALLLQNERLIETTQSTLNYLIGWNAETKITADGTLSHLEGFEWETLKSRAMAQNTGVLVQKATIAVRDAERKEARANYFPQLSVYGQYVYSKSENQVGILNSNRSLGPGVGFSLSWNILNDLSTYTQFKNAKIQQESAEFAVKDQELFVTAELKKAFDNYIWTQKSLQLEEANIIEVKSSFEIAKVAYMNGTMTDLELREFQFSILQAQLRYFQLQLEVKTAEMNVRLLSGDFQDMLP